MDIAAKQALRQMIKLIRDISNLSKEEAYTLNSISANMQVSQIVNVHKRCSLHATKVNVLRRRMIIRQTTT